MRTLLWVLVLSLPIFADRIFLKDDRVLEGKAKEDGDHWIIKTKIGTVRIHKDEVIRVEKSDDPGPKGTPGGTPDEGPDGGAYESKKDGFSFHIKGKGWRIENEPPRPLVSATAVNDGLGVEISVVHLDDEEAGVPLSEEAAKSLQPTVEALLAVSTLELYNVEMERFPMPSATAYLFRAEGKRKLTTTDLVLRAVTLKSSGKVWILLYEAPLGAPSAAEGAFEQLVDSFKAGPGGGGGGDVARDVFTSGTLAFSLARPEGWLMEAKDGDTSVSASLSARDGTAEATFDAKMEEFETDLRRAATDLSGRLEGELASFEAGNQEMRTMANRTTRIFGFTYRREGTARAGVALVTREGERVFEIVVRSAQEPTARKALETIMAGFRVIKEEASVIVPTGGVMDAIKALRDGDEQYLGGEYKTAQAMYRKAVRAWPKFAHASLMLARCSLMREEMEEAVAEAEKAHAALPGRQGVAELLACCRARNGKLLAMHRDYKKAAESLCKAGALKIRNDDFEWEIGEAAVAFTGEAKSEDYDAIYDAMKKVNAAMPGMASFVEELARVCRWVVGREMDAGNWAKATQVANEGLKIKPRDSGLEELLDQIKEAQGEKK